MNRKTLLLIASWLLMPVLMLAQKGTISGYIEDARSGEKLIAASVFDQKSGLGTTTNEYGFYSLTLPEGEIQFTVSYVGYSTYSEKVMLKGKIVKVVDLEPSIELEEVTVTTNRPQDIVQDVQMSSTSISPQQIKSIPLFMGVPDVMKALQLMPGVQSGTEGTSGIYVRGGGPDQNLVLLDGVSIYNADHLFGFFSVFNPDAISSITLYKGGFPARYGGRLSSVIDIRLKDGNMKEFHAKGSVGIIDSRIMLEGPIIKDKTSFMISARRTYGDLFVRPVVRIINNYSGNTGTAGYYFYDVNLKINHKFSDKDRVFLSLYSGKDKVFVTNEYEYIYNDSTYMNRDEFGLYWGNLTSVLRWNHVFGSKLFSNVSVLYSNYKFDTYENYYSFINKRKIGEYKFDYFSGIEDEGAMVDFDFDPSPAHSIKFGGKYLYHNFKPGITAFRTTGITDSLDINFGNKNIYANEAYVYIEDDIDITRRLSANIGLHYSVFSVQDELYSSLQPRMSLRLLVSKNLSFKAAASKMQQYIHLLTNSTIGLPTDLWLPTTKLIPPENSWQYAAGAAYNLKDTYTITLEGFYKNMKNLIEYKEGASFMDIGTSWEGKVDIGDGWSYGAEFMIRKDAGKFTGWLGYTLSWSMRQFKDQNQGKVFPFRYDRRHDIAIVAMYKINEKTDVSATWVYGTGRAVTLGVARYAPENFSFGNNPYYYYDTWQEIEYYNGKNSFREPSFHHLDLAVNRHKTKKWGEQTWSFSVYNAYNHLNPFFLYFGYDYIDGNSIRRLKQISIFPIIPSVSYAFSF
ncbi:MAG: TonB-dependent receptor [Bacteroidota bacterium]